MDAENDCQEQSLTALAGSKSEVPDVLSQVAATRGGSVPECQSIVFKTEHFLDLAFINGEYRCYNEPKKSF